MSRRRGKLNKNPQAYGTDPHEDIRVMKFTTHALGTVTSSAAGVVDTAITMDPSTQSGNDWADFSSLYDEFRVLGVRLTFTSAGPNANNNGGLMVAAFDNDSAAAPGSFSAAQQLSTSSYLPVIWSTLPIVKTFWRPVAGVETTIPWIDVGNPSGSLGAVQLYASGLTVSTTYMVVAQEYFCEFRGRR